MTVGDMRFVAHGGGVQTTAMLVLAAQRRIDYQVFLFANVGDDSENPDTFAYLDKYARPYADQHGIEIKELVRVPKRGRSKGEVETLLGRLTREGSRSLPIPVRMADTGAPGTRNCTLDFKIRVLQGHVKEHYGASAERPATMALGFSLDEIHRIKDDRPDRPFERLVYPLVSVGDDTGLRLNRAACEQVITDAGLPVPPKSSCWFCPLHTLAAWSEMRRDHPDRFEATAELEDLLNTRRTELGKDPVYFSRRLLPLRVATPTAQDTLFDLGIDDDGACDDSSCFT